MTGNKFIFREACSNFLETLLEKVAQGSVQQDIVIWTNAALYSRNSLGTSERKVVRPVPSLTSVMLIVIAIAAGGETSGIMYSRPICVYFQVPPLPPPPSESHLI